MLIRINYSQKTGEIQGFSEIEIGSTEGSIDNNQLFITPHEYKIIRKESALWNVKDNHLIRAENGEDITEWMTNKDTHHDESDQAFRQEPIDENQNIYVASLSEYLNAIQSLENNSPINPLFRGQNQRWPLLPKLGRYPLLKNEPRYQAEKKMLSDLKRMSPLLLETIPETELEWLSIAQHYGMATRLLDWTQNPLVALWFSVSRSTNSSSDRGEVWCFYPKSEDIIGQLNINPFNITKVMVYIPKHVSKRIAAQYGCFTIHPYIPSNSTYTDNEKDNFLTLSSKNCDSRPLMFSIFVKNENFAKIRIELNQCGINSSSMFPDMNGLCRHVEWQYLLTDNQ